MRRVYAVMANTDKVEGRGHAYVVCLVERKALANELVLGPEYAAGFGWMGQPGNPEYDVKELHIVSSVKDFAKMVKKKA